MDAIADTKASDLAALTGANIATGDEFVLVDKSDTTMAASGTDKRMTAAELRIALATTLGLTGIDQIYDAAGDLAVGSGADTAVKLAVGTLAGQALAADPNATNKLSWQYPHAVEMATRGTTGSLASTFDRATVTSVGNVATLSGRLHLVRIILPKGLPVTTITFVSGSTAMVTGTNQVFGLFNASRVQLAITADDTNVAWAANTAKTLTVTGGPFVTTYAGWYYLGIAVAASTVPSLQGGATMDGYQTSAVPLVTGTSNTGLTNPASWPSTATALSATSVPLYAEVS